MSDRPVHPVHSMTPGALDSAVLMRTRIAVALLAVILAAALLVDLRLAPDALHDDAFISLRYARHLAQGQGLVFNPGERVEGYTNFLWTVVLAVPHRLHADAVHWAQAMSILAGLGCAGAAFVLLRGRGESAAAWGPAAAGAALLVAAQPFMVAESVGGLETTAFVLLVLLALVRDTAERQGRAAAGGAAAWLGVATLVRPEGALAFACLAALQAADPARRRTLARPLGAYAACVVPLLIFRLAYYHDWVPNTYHAKVAFGAAQLARGTRYAWDFGGRALLPALPLATWAAWRGRTWERAAAVIAIAHTVWVVAVGGDFAPTGRFLLLPAVLVAALAARGIGMAYGRQPATALLALAVLTAWPVYDEARVLQRRHWPASYRTDLAARRFFGRWLAATQPAGVTIAVGSIGAIGYESDRRLLDTFGLTDAEIGRMPVDWMGRASAGHEKGDAASVLRRAPDLIVFDRAFLAPRELGLEEFLAQARSPTERMLVEDPRFFEHYGLKTVATSAGVVHVLERIR